MVVTRPQMMTMTTNEALVGYISDNSGASTLKIAAKAVALTANIAPASPANKTQLYHRKQALISYQPHVPSHSTRSSVSPQLLVQQHTAMKGLQVDYQ